MAFETHNNTGAAFNNDRKAKENHPDFKGSAKVKGVELWMAIWFREAGPESQIAGQKFMSIAFQPKDQTEYDKTQYRGAAFEVEDDSAGSPDYTGPATINGEEYQINVRVKEAGPNAKKPGSTYYSLTFEHRVSIPEPGKPASKTAPAQTAFGGDFDDDIPF